MLFVDKIIKIVKLGIASAYIKNEKTRLNIILLANPEAGKTSMLLNFDLKKLKHVFAFSDLTRSKLEKFIKELNNPRESMIRYIIVPDFTRLISHSKDTQRGLIGLLNSALEEGVMEVTSYFGSGMSDTKPFNHPVRLGVATSATRTFISDRRRTSFWHSIGFMSRMLPISFSYTKEQVVVIRKHIADGKDLFDEPEIMRLKDMKVSCKGKFVAEFGDYIEKLAEASSLLGFRYTKEFRIMLKANALLRGSSNVTKRDVKDLMPLMKYINLDYNKVV